MKILGSAAYLLDHSSLLISALVARRRRNNRKRIVMTPFITLVVAGGLMCSSLLVHAETIELVTIDYPPYYGQELKNQGFITEIITTAFSRSGYEVKTKYLPWQRAFDGTKAGKYPAIYTMWYRGSTAAATSTPSASCSTSC